VIGIFKNNNPLALLLLALLAFLPWTTSNSVLNSPVPEGSTAIFKELSSFLSFLNPSKSMMGKIIISSFLLVEALLLNKIISDHKLAEKAGFLPAMSFLLLNALLPSPMFPVSIVLSGMMMLVFKLLILMYKENNANNKLLLTGFVVGSMALMNTGFLVLYCWSTICIMIMRPASMREWLLSTIGFMLPFYFLASGLYLLDKLDPSIIFPAFPVKFELPVFKPLEWIKTGLFLILPWIGMFSFNVQIGKMMIQARKAYLVILVLNTVLILIGMLSIKDMSTILPLMLVPTAMLFFPLFLAFKRNFIPNLLLLALIILALLR
jgi:hypothetical protein